MHQFFLTTHPSDWRGGTPHPSLAIAMLHQKTLSQESWIFEVQFIQLEGTWCQNSIWIHSNGIRTTILAPYDPELQKLLQAAQNDPKNKEEGSDSV